MRAMTDDVRCGSLGMSAVVYVLAGFLLGIGAMIVWANPRDRYAA